MHTHVLLTPRNRFLSNCWSPDFQKWGFIIRFLKTFPGITFVSWTYTVDLFFLFLVVGFGFYFPYYLLLCLSAPDSLSLFPSEEDSGSSSSSWQHTTLHRIVKTRAMPSSHSCNALCWDWIFIARKSFSSKKRLPEKGSLETDKSQFLSEL